MQRFACLGILVACNGVPPTATPDAAAPIDAAPEASAPQPTDFTSGTRLRAEIRSGGDARTFRGWFDSQLGLDCSFATAEDGKLRCLPTSLGEVTYSDPACTQPAAVSGHWPQAAPLYGVTPDKCRPRAVFVGTGDVIALQDDYTIADGGQCVRADQAYWEYPNVTHVDPATFVAASIETRAIDAQISANVLVAEDGATHVIGAHDVEHGDDCDLQSAPDGTPVCAPALSTPFGCNGASFSACASSPPSVLAVRAGCGYTGALATTAGTCTNAPELAAFTPGGPIDFPALARNPLGDGRLRAMWTSHGGSPIRATSFYDTDLDVECDGAGSCLPIVYEPMFQSGFYADPICTQPVIIDQGGCGGLVSWVRTPYAWFRRGAALLRGAAIYVRGGYLACSKTSATGPAYATTRVPDDAFATLTDSIE